MGQVKRIHGQAVNRKGIESKVPRRASKIAGSLAMPGGKPLAVDKLFEWERPIKRLRCR